MSIDTEKRLVFLATPGGKSDTIARQLLAERTAAQQARLDYIKSKGIENLWANENAVAGLIVKPDAIPAGFRKDAKYGTDADGHVCAIPDGKQRATYKEACKELASIPRLPGCMELDNRLGFGGYITGRCWMMISCEIVCGRMILSVPRMEKNQFVPPDCSPLRFSEYFTLVEQAEANKEAATADVKL